MRLFGSHEAAGHHHLHRLARADDARQAPEPAEVGEEAALHVGDLEAGGGRGDGHVAVRHEVEAGADADAVDGGDDGYLQPSQRDVGLGLSAEAQAAAFEVEWRRLGRGRALGGGGAAEVGAGAETPAGAGDHQAADGAVLAGFTEDGLELGEGRHAESVELFGPVEGEPEDALVLAASFG